MIAANPPTTATSEAFGEQLSHDSPARGAERLAKRVVAHARGGAREHQAREIHAHDEEEKAHGAEQDDERGPHVAGERGEHGLDAQRPSQLVRDSRSDTRAAARRRTH